MSRRVHSIVFAALAFALAWMTVSSPADAKKAATSELTFSLDEDETGVTVHVRGLRPQDTERGVVTSKTGYLLFFDGYRASAARLRTKEKHRLSFAQIGQTKDRVALRLTQAKRTKGSLNAFVETTAVDGGVDFRIRDDATAVPAAASEGAPQTEEPRDPAERAATLAALQATLDDGADPSPSEPLGDAAAAVLTEPAPPAPDDSPPDDEGFGGPSAEVDAPDSNAGALLETDEESGSPSIIRGALGLLVVVAGGAGALWWAKHRQKSGTDAGLTVVSRVGVGPKQAVVWIRAGSRELLLGATERSIDVLAELGPGAPAPAIAALDAPRPAPIAGPAPAPAAPARIAAFKAKLERALGDELSRDAPDEDEDDTPPHLKVLTEDPRWATRAQDVA